MNFLQMCQEVNTLVGLQGTFSSASAATGMQATLAQMVANAWIDIQTLRKDWHFMRSSVSFNTVQGTVEYSLTTMFGGSAVDIANWIPGGIYYTDSNSFDTPLRQITYDQYVERDIAQADQQLPAQFAQDPVDKHLWLNPPLSAYTITCHYVANPVTLSGNADVPLLPTSFHKAIVYRAATDMAAFLGNGNAYALYQQKADAMIGSLLRSENPGQRVVTMGIA